MCLPDTLAPTLVTARDPAGAPPGTGPMADTAGMSGQQTSVELRPHRLARLTPVLLVRAAHPRQALVTAAGLAVAAALSGRPGREVALVAATVLVGQGVLGWDNDLVDERADREEE